MIGERLLRPAMVTVAKAAALRRLLRRLPTAPADRFDARFDGSRSASRLPELRAAWAGPWCVSSSEAAWDALRRARWNAEAPSRSRREPARSWASPAPMASRSPTIALAALTAGAQDAVIDFTRPMVLQRGAGRAGRPGAASCTSSARPAFRPMLRLASGAGLRAPCRVIVESGNMSLGVDSAGRALVEGRRLKAPCPAMTSVVVEMHHQA